MKNVTVTLSLAELNNFLAFVNELDAEVIGEQIISGEEDLDDLQDVNQSDLWDRINQFRTTETKLINAARAVEEG